MTQKGDSPKDLELQVVASEFGLADLQRCH